MEDHHQERELGRVSVRDLVGMAGLGVFIDHLEYRRGNHFDVDESIYSLE